MANGGMEFDFSALCLAEKIIISGVSECKCCFNLKRELKEIQEELSSDKLIIELSQTEGSAKDRVGYGTLELCNLIVTKKVNAEKIQENKWIEVISSRNRRTKR